MHQFDVTSAAFKADPFPVLAEMRAAGPVVQTRLPVVGKLWFATTYESAKDLLRDSDHFVREGRNAGKRRFSDIQWLLTQLFRSIGQNMLAKDEPDHRRLRTLVEQAFARRSVDGMRQRIVELADKALDQTVAAGDDGRIEFAEFSRQFPLMVITELLGLPDEDRPIFSKWASSFSQVSSLASILRMMPSFLHIKRYLQRQLRDCAREPREGLLTLLVQAESEGDSLSENEATAMAFLLLFAGHETTTHLIANGLVALLENREQLDRWRTDWAQSDRAVDEILRYTTPVQFAKPRYVASDYHFHGVDLPRQALVMPVIAAANSDPAAFDDPERLNLQRAPNHHLGFGAGIHTCLGLKLAKMETEIAFQRLFTRYPDVTLDAADEIEWNSRLGMRSVKSLPVRLA